MNGKNNARNCFVGLNSRNVLGQVGRLGEEITAALVGGEIVADDPQNLLFADVVNRVNRLAVQVKMCNGRHAQRPMPQQVIDLFNEIDNPYLFSKGVYAFVFYGGIHYKRKSRGKSKIWSRKFSRGMRREIIAHELQYIYLIDVRLLKHILDFEQYIKKGAIVYVPEEKPNRGQVLYLNRTFMKGFPVKRESHVKLLDQTFGRGHWSVQTVVSKLRFSESSEGTFKRKVPVHVIGSCKVVRSVMELLGRPHAPVRLDHVEASDMCANPPRG